jgi:hypothetical protein
MMFRITYSRLLRLHPHRFRQRFGDEMMAIFDHTHGTRARLILLVDAFVSVLRQSALRPEFLQEAAPSVIDAGPMFYSLEPFKPRRIILVYGAALTLALFCGVCFLFNHGVNAILPEGFSHAQYGTVTPSLALGVQQETVAPSASLSSSIPVEVPEQILQSYVGVYVVQSPDQVALSITLENGRLSLAIPDQPRIALIPVSQNRFNAINRPRLWIEFLKIGTGDYELQVHDGGKIVTAKPASASQHQSHS